MRKVLLVTFIFLMCTCLFAQKVSVKVINTLFSAKSEWQILDDQQNLVFSGNQFFRDDSVFFTLNPNSRYFFHVSVSEVYTSGTGIYSLWINEEPVLLVLSDTEPGDKTYPFFTGIKKPETKITGGTNADISEFPWQVYFVSGDYFCGGSIISDNWVVTAAHCTENSNGTPIPAADMSVKVGANDPHNPLQGKKYSVSQVIVNEGYNGSTLDNDIALLKLAEPINFPNAKPIKLILPTDVTDGATDPGVFSWVTGWGLIRVSPETFPTLLQKVQLPIVSNSQAGTVWKNIPASDIMAGYLNGNKDACNGDSGGPLVVPVSDEYKLAGLVSWGSPNCNTYGAYTRISSFESWIRTKTGIPREYTPPVPGGDTLICQGVDSGLYSINALTGASVYEWKLLPAEAGTISGNTGIATVLWSKTYIGSVVVELRVTINNKVSEWSKLKAKIIKRTKLLIQSRDTVICANQPVTLNVGAEGYNLIFSWYKDNKLTQTGRSEKLNYQSALTENTGKYFCQITGSCGTLVSGIINLTVHPLTRITYISPDTKVAFGDNVTLEVRSEGYDLMYKWTKDAKVLENSNFPQFSIARVNANDIGLYNATVIGACGTENSDTLYLYVKRENYSAEPDIFLWPTITSSYFNVALSNDDYYNIRLVSISGNLIIEQANCRYQTTIDASKLARGVYIVNIYNRNFRRSLKLIKN
jgi:hypothetical protein